MSRDSQQKKVYRAEGRAEGLYNLELSTKCAIEGTNFKAKAFTFEEVAPYYAAIMKTRWWHTRYPRHTHLKVEQARGYLAQCEGSTIRYGRQRELTDWLLLHELAHYCAPWSEHHGRGYCKIYIELVSRFIGINAGRMLKKEFVNFKVKHTKRKKYRADMLKAAKERGRALLALSRTGLARSASGI